MSTPAKTAASALKTAQTGDGTAQIVPNAPEVAQNPVPATERDTPVLIQYSAPEPAPSTTAPITLAAPSPVSATAAPVVALAQAILDAVAAPEADTTHLVAVKMLKNHPKVGAFKGTTTKLPAKLAAELIAAEFAVEATDQDGTPETSGYTETL